jgi:hypothetical protein
MRTKLWWKDLKGDGANIKIHFKKLVWEGVDRIYLVLYWDR